MMLRDSRPPLFTCEIRDVNPPEFLDLQVVDSHVHFDDTKYAAVMLKVIEGARFHRINLASLISRQKVNSNPESLYFKAKHPKRTYAFGALDYSPLFLGERWGSLDLAAQADTLMKIGFDGVKMVEGKPTSRKMVPLYLDGEAYEEFFSKADSSGFPILLHVADPEEFWDVAKVPMWAKKHGWFYGNGSYPEKEQLYMEIDNVLEEHPGMKVIFPHFYFLSADLERAARLLNRYPNVYLDLTPGIEMYYNFSRDTEKSREFFLRYQDRILFGTDITSDLTLSQALARAWIVRKFLETDESFHLPAHADELLEGPVEAPLRGLGLPSDVLGKIYARNFEKIAGKEPARISLDLAVAECERLGATVEKIGTEERLKSALEIARRLREIG